MSTHEPDRNEPSANSQPPDDIGRRRALTVAITALGAGLGAVAVGPGLVALAFPWTEETTSSEDAFVPAGKPASFVEGVPVKVDLYADQTDAWNRFENVKIGSAWVIRRQGELLAYSTVCPHLGCAIDYDATERKFACPCHRSRFGLDGAVEAGPSPRALDRLEVEHTDKLVEIRYRRFRQGVGTQEPM